MLEVRNLAYAHPRDPRPILRGLDFTVARGEILAVLGPAGAGKTTLQKVLAGFIREYTGEVSFQGRELRDWGREFFERIGVACGFTGHFLKLTALENLAYFGRLYPGNPGSVAALPLLEQVGLAGDAGRRVAGFPAEKRSRLGVARALLHGPDAVFLDEPTAGLAPADARRIEQLIAAQRAAGRCVVLTTRDPGLAEALGDRVAFLAEGRILALDRPGDLRVKHGKGGDGLEAAFQALAGRSHS